MSEKKKKEKSSSSSQKTGEILTQEFFFYEEDIVQLNQKKKKKKKKKEPKPKLGMVTEVGGNENTSFDDSSDSDEEKPQVGECTVKWADGNVQNVLKSNLNLMDRSMCHGNVVKKMVTFPKGQSGSVVGVDLRTDLDVVGTGKVYKNFDSKKLKFPCGGVGKGKKCIYLKEYLAKIKRVYYFLEIEFKGGEICQISNVIDKEFLGEKDEKLVTDSSFPFHVSQKLNFNEGEGDKREKCFFRNEKEKNEKNLENTTWIKGDGIYSKKKHSRGIIKNVEIQYVDIIILTEFGNMNSKDSTVEKEIEVGEIIFGVNLKDIYFPFDDFEYANFGFLDFCYANIKDLEPESKENKLVLCKISMTKTIVDVAWQDGSIEKGIHSIDLYPDVNVLEDVFYPNGFVSFEDLESKKQCTGIVKEMDHLSRMCKVDLVDENGEIVSEKNITCFEIKDHSQFEFSLGDILLNLDLNIWKDGNNEKEVNSREQPWAGKLIALEHEKLRVKWTNGTISSVNFSKVIPIEEISSSSSSSSEEGEEEGEEEEEQEGEGEEEERREEDRSEYSTDVVFREDNEEEELKKNFAFSEEVEECNTKSLKKEYFNDNSDSEKKEIKLQPLSTQFFVINGDFTRNRFLKKGDIVPNSISKLPQIMKKEWKILKDSLPKYICVFASRNRMDLLQSLIVGAAGTPYAHCFFIFDIYLGEEYDFRPPSVLCWSFGYDINPNIDPKDDSICLSLLGTWESSNEEYNWKQGVSNINQVLLSLGSIVLNENPYFNEAGFKTQEGTRKGEINSELYNETTFLNVLKNQLKFFDKMPKEMIPFVKEKLKTGLLKTALKDILKNGGSYAFNVRKNSSIGFRSVIRILIPQLLQKIENFVNSN